MPSPAQTSGVRWSGMSDEPSWTPSPEAQAEAMSAYLKAKARMEAAIAARAESMGLTKKVAA